MISDAVSHELLDAQNSCRRPCCPFLSALTASRRSSPAAVCSACIRSNIDFKLRQGLAPACPQCRAPCGDQDLRPNIALREAVAAFEAARQLLLDAVLYSARLAAAPAGGPQAGAGPSSAAAGPSRRTAAEPVRPRRTRQRSETETVNLISDGESADGDSDGDYQVRPFFRSGHAVHPSHDRYWLPQMPHISVIPTFCHLLRLCPAG